MGWRGLLGRGWLCLAAAFLLVLICCPRGHAQGRIDQWPTLRQTFVPRSQTIPHPAVTRVIVDEGNGASVGSGTLVHVDGQYGLVVTNWHVVRDVRGPIAVIFPDGFRSAAQILKVDRDWDLAALAVWRPRATPVPLAREAPRPGELLTIAGYGGGRYRATSGHCTQYVAPDENLPYEMVELAAGARQGDSGGPIFNARGELAGVLFGSNGRTTSGSYAGRVARFLDSVTPNLRQTGAQNLADGPESGAPSRTSQELASARTSPTTPTSTTPWTMADGPNAAGGPPGSARLTRPFLAENDSARQAISGSQAPASHAADGQASGGRNAGEAAASSGLVAARSASGGTAAPPPLETVRIASLPFAPDGTRPIAPPTDDDLPLDPNASKGAAHAADAVAREYLRAEHAPAAELESADRGPAWLPDSPWAWLQSTLALVGLLALGMQVIQWLGRPSPESPDSSSTKAADRKGPVRE